MVFVFNKIPRFRDDNDATAKKMLMVGFNRVYSDEEKDTNLIEKLTTDQNKEAFVKLAINAMKNVLHRNLTFTVSEESKQVVAQIMEESDQFVSFIADKISDDYSWKTFLDGKKTEDVYSEFREWTIAEGYQSPLVRKQFTERCCKESGATTRKSHGSRFYEFPK
jgi:phage/plasmid-associated DNA primase